MTTLASITNEFSWLHESTPVAGATQVVGIWVASVGATLLAIGFTAVIRHDCARHGPVFRHLARGLGLGHGERRLLYQVARIGGVPAGSLLITRGCFDAAAKSFEERYGTARSLRVIRDRVFEE